MSLIQSLMVDLQQQYAGNLDKYEQRASKYGALKFFQEEGQKSDGIFDPEIRAMVDRSFGRNVVVPVLDAQDVTIGNVRQCTVPDSENVSQLVTYTFVTYAFGFTMTPAQHMNNDVKYQADFNRKLKKYLTKFAAVLDTQCVDTLELDRNIFWTDDITTSYGYDLAATQAADAIQIPDANKRLFYNNLTSIMEQMDFYDTTNVVTSPVQMADVREYYAQGAGNASNEAFQFNNVYGGYKWHSTNRVVNGAATIGSTLYAMPEGTVGLLNRNDPDALMGARVHEGEYWDIVRAPLVDLDMGYKYTRSCANRISDLGLGGAAGVATQPSVTERSLLESHEWSTDVLFKTAYVSDKANVYSPIVKAEVLLP